MNNIIIEVRGGFVCNVITDTEYTKIIVVDWDRIGEDNPVIYEESPLITNDVSSAFDTNVSYDQEARERLKQVLNNG